MKKVKKYKHVITFTVDGEEREITLITGARRNKRRVKSRFFKSIEKTGIHRHQIRIIDLLSNLEIHPRSEEVKAA